jgi:hypothetical protein
LGYFLSTDGFGIELGYINGGIDLKLPILVGSGLNFTDNEYKDGLISIFKGAILFLGLNIITSGLIKAVSHTFAAKSKSNEELEKRKCQVEENRKYTQKLIDHICIQSDTNHSLEIERNTKGLIIHLALYGSKKKLKYILNNFLYIKRDELKAFVTDIENEIFDVTVPTRYLIKRDPKKCFSSILFHHIPKTKIIGYTNPIYTSEKKPYLLLR